jgi:integrase
MAVGLGARRGEVLALRWSDIVDGRAVIARSLSQANGKLEFKGTKTDESRVVKVRRRRWRNQGATVSARMSSG